MRLSLFLNPWGASSFSRHLPTLLAEARRRGYAGVEMSLADLGADAAARRGTADLIESHGLRLILGLYTSWDDYEGPWRPSTPHQHCAQLEQQLRAASGLGTVVTHMNLHGGCDSWDERAQASYWNDALPLVSAFLEEHQHVGAAGREADVFGSRPTHLTGASHETHRGRILHHPYATLRALEAYPPLRLTADLSHWHVVAERLVGTDDAAEAAEVHESVAFHVDHIHARIGGTQSPQLPAHPPAHPEAASERDAATACHVAFWKAVWSHKAARGVVEVSATPEYGPFPYQATGGAPELWEQTMAAGELVRAAFAEWGAEQEGREGSASGAPAVQREHR